MKIQTKFGLYIGVVLFLVFILLVFFSYRQARFEAESDAFATCEKLVSNAAASRSYVREVLRPKMFEIIEEGQFIPEGMSGSFVTRKQFDFFLKDYPDYLMNFASKNPRNPDNKANAIELDIIEKFISTPSLNTWKGITTKGTIEYMTVAKAFRFKKPCMLCHGDPADAPQSLVKQYGNKNGFWAKEGGVTIYSVGVPINVTFARVSKRVLNAILPVIGVLAILFYMLNNYFRKTVSAPVNALTKGVHKITRGDYSEHISIEGTSEFKDLAFAFNALVDELSGSKSKQITAERKYRDLYNNAPDMFLSIDTKTGKIIDCNNILLRQLGYSKDEVIDSPISSMYHPDSRDRAETFFQVFDKTGKIHNAELVLTRKDGSTLDVSLNASAIRDGEGNILQRNSIWRDISKQKSKEQENEKLEIQLCQAHKMESIGTLAAGIAHDFNNILSAVIGFTELALNAVEKETPIQEDLQEVYKAGLRAKDLVRQISSFARQSSEELKLIRIDTIIKEVLNFIRSSIPTTIEIKQNIVSDSLIMGNSTQLHRIMMNLCTNAAHAMENKGGALEIILKDITIDRVPMRGNSHLKSGNYIEIKVSDTGDGIAPQIIDKIFEPYFTTKGPGEGTGMGLAMVHGIVETYGGKIFVESKLGKGTIFTIYLPVAREGKAHQQYKVKELPTGQERILFVDDEAQIAKMASRMLGQLGYSVTTRTSSVDALEVFKAKPSDFDLVISDVTMPKMTGDQLAKELLEIRPDIPVILCTGYSKRLSEEKSSEIGIKAFAHKPIVKEDLATTVRRVLDKAKA